MPKAKTDNTEDKEWYENLKVQDPPPPFQPLEKAWLNITFSGFEPDDTLASLFRRWKGTIQGYRSDGEVLEIPLIAIQRDGPYDVGIALSVAFARLESYRNCACTAKVKCQDHADHDTTDPEGNSA